MGRVGNCPLLGCFGTHMNGLASLLESHYGFSKPRRELGSFPLSALVLVHCCARVETAAGCSLVPSRNGAPPLPQQLYFYLVSLFLLLKCESQ